MQKITILSTVFILDKEGKDLILDSYLESNDEKENVEDKINDLLATLKARILDKINPSSEVIGNHSAGDCKAD